MKRHRILIAVSSAILVILTAWALVSWATRDRFRSTADRLLLLVPDKQLVMFLLTRLVHMLVN